MDAEKKIFCDKLFFWIIEANFTFIRMSIFTQMTDYVCYLVENMSEFIGYKVKTPNGVRYDCDDMELISIHLIT